MNKMEKAAVKCEVLRLFFLRKFGKDWYTMANRTRTNRIEFHLNDEEKNTG